MNAPFNAAAVAEEAVRRAAEYTHLASEYAEESEGEGSISVQLPPSFSLSRNGLFFHPSRPGAGESEPTAIWVSKPIFVSAETQDDSGTSWGLLLEWKDRDGRPHQWAMSRRLLHSDGKEIAATLEDAGLSVGTGRQAHELLQRFLAGVSVDRRIRCVNRTGWHSTERGFVFVLSEEERIGAAAGEIVLQADRDCASGAVTESKGTLKDWQEQVAALAVGNNLLALFLCTAFTGPLLEMMAEPSGGLHIYGKSQSGKTTALAVAASVWGRADTSGIIKSWRATANGLEGVAATSTDALLVLDELGMADANEVGSIIYQLGNETGKARATRDGSAKPRRTWRLPYLSSGEIPVASKMGERGNTVHAGQDVRLANIPADAGAGMGLFQQLHRMASPAALATHLREATRRRAYGTAARAFLEHLVADRNASEDDVIARIDDWRRKFLAKVLPENADGQVISVARRFGLSAAAGHLATQYGILPWQDGEAFQAAAFGFKAWLRERGGIGASEDRQAIAQVRRFIEAHEESRFRLLERNSQYHSGDDEVRSGREVLNRVGFRREIDGGWEFLIFPESWKSEVCRGLDPLRAAASLHAAGFLAKGEGSHLAKKHRVPGISTARFYTVSSRILANET